jgi:hypothetical protein
MHFLRGNKLGEKAKNGSHLESNPGPFFPAKRQNTVDGICTIWTDLDYIFPSTV